MYVLTVLLLLYTHQTAAQITPDSARHVHHMLLYLCDGFNLTGDPAVGVSQECNGISQKILPCRSSIVIASWAVSGNVRCIILYYFFP